jgi:excisionase family DNA binding protein
MDRKLDGEEAAPDFMTAAEVAAWLRVGLSTLYGWTASGRIPYVKFNGVVRFQRNQLTGWMQQHTTRPSVSSDNVSERISGARPRPLTHRTMVDAAARVRRRLLSTKKPIQYGDGQ